ncbi:DUF3375 domain-containing protein [Williamsia sp. 1135]|uniref:DUF3375 domain-containing protein n=1 Tax=Williamsia sp. 1135 TaxID=1889262 RepID=UPI000A10254D|nr:DUF3375 domain-containing protein [Williamsia sp. 1135]ORM34994.1 hypothetical protein BFL43_10500 [Williamsia sp. 1135]
MARPTAAQLYAAYGDNADSDVTLRLLRSRNAVPYLAIMAARLADGQVDGDHLSAGVEKDLADLADHWLQRGWELPTADDLLDRWVRAGYLARTLVTDTQIERYQLTRGATQAIAQVQAVRQNRTVATETVLELVMSRLSNIAVSINPDPGEHIRDIDQKLSELTARRAELAAGAIPAVDTRRVLDDIRMVSSLAERMPADIIGYGEKMRENSRALLTSGLDAEQGSHADVLNRMFDGHDALADSDEGKAFDTFYTLIADHRLREDLEASIAAIASGLPNLPHDLLDTLTGFIDRMWDEVQSVDEVRGQVYRRINTFVKDGDFLHYRALRSQISDAQRAAAAAFVHAGPGKDMGIAVPMSAASSNSVGALVFHDGIIDSPGAVADTAGEIRIDPADLVGVESIDWHALTDAVNDAIASGPAGIDEVLALLPTARTGDVIGIWSLAQRHGATDDTRAEITVLAHTARGLREITMPAVLFTHSLPDPITAQPHEVMHLLDEPDEAGQKVVR